MRIAVTGAGGFLGRALVDELLSSGCEVVAFGRSAMSTTAGDVSNRPFDLASALDPHILADVDEVIHCAFQRFDRRHPGAFDNNVVGTMALHDASVSRGIRFTFISSLAAVPETTSNYGRQKMMIERELRKRGSFIVRPGLIVGDGGLTRAIYQTIKRTRAIPLFDGGRQPIQYISLNDAALAIRRFTESDRSLRTITIAASTPITAREFALGIRDRFGLPGVPLSMPLGPVLQVIEGAERLGIKLPLSSETLLGVRMSRIQSLTPVGDLLGCAFKQWPDLLRELQLQ
jgi:nucleoside-diphosphate-sugar epimerase